MLIRFAQSVLDHAQWPSSVLTGRMMFNLGDNERHTAERRSRKQHDSQAVL
jgi:hypothetical protein